MQYVDFLSRSSQPSPGRAWVRVGRFGIFTGNDIIAQTVLARLLTFREAFLSYLTLHALSGKRDRLTNRRLVEGVKFLVKPTREVNIVIMHFFTQARCTKPFDLS